jgi:hypothetical protein
MSAEASAVTAVADWPNPGRYPFLAKAKHFSWLPGLSWPKPGPVFVSIASIGSAGPNLVLARRTAKARMVGKHRQNKMWEELFIFFA